MRAATAFVSAAVLLSALAASQPARAADDLSVELHGTALAGKDRTQIIVHARAPVTALSLELTTSEGRAVHDSIGRLGRGGEHAFDLRQDVAGTAHFHGRLVARFPHGPPKEMPLDFDATLVAPLKLTARGYDLAARTTTLVPSFEPSKLHLTVIDDDGTTPVDEDQTVTSKAGEPIVVTWPVPARGRVLKVDVRLFDHFGYWIDYELSPWNIDLPHEDVLFDNGESVIVASERPKLDAAYGELAKALAKYGHLAKIQLYVGGYTDTVGDAASNRRLSEARALSIARYFRQKGARLPIFFVGFGEDGLLVPTPDETAEPKNRRATYVVSIEPPAGATWKRLP